MPAVQARDAEAYGATIFAAYGVPPNDAARVARELIRNERMGYESHGVVRFVEYFAEIEQGRIVPGASITVLQESESTAVLDCGLNLGIVGAFAALDVATAKASARGLSLVVTRRCNHAGRLGAYVEAAARSGYIAVAGASIPPRGHFVVPFGGSEGRLGTNPFAYAVPTESDPVVADFSTSVLPEGKVRAARNRGAKLPTGAVLDGSGKETQDPAAFYGPPVGKLLPFGGTVGHKGYALGLMVELLGATLAGEGATGGDRPVNSLWLLVIDPERFLPAGKYESGASEVVRYMRSAAPAAGFDRVRVPGDMAFEKLRGASSDQSIDIGDKTWRQLVEAGLRKGIGPPQPIPPARWQD